MYNVNDFVCSIPQMKREFRASFHQLTKFSTIIGGQTQLYETFASMCDWFPNTSHTHIFAVDWDIWRVNWFAPCYFNGASPTRSPRWGHCLSAALGSAWRTLLPICKRTIKHKYPVPIIRCSVRIYKVILMLVRWDGILTGFWIPRLNGVIIWIVVAGIAFSCIYIYIYIYTYMHIYILSYVLEAVNTPTVKGLICTISTGINIVRNPIIWQLSELLFI